MSRITRNSYRPRASDRSMCCQPGNHSACQLRKPIDVVATKLKMQLRWNHARPAAGPEGRKPKRNGSHNEQGLEVKDTLSPSGRGRRMSLTFPLIDQALARFDRWSMSVIAIFCQRWTSKRLLRLIVASALEIAA